ncbi:phosphate transport system permease protein [Halopseudomonas litoralis]|uniref:Phosphate transport system permease protein PstA n=1 Tax=Halopseudomonas litoralis TaxID=797277 RepID=A0A1H1WLE3_9GAMM|nr:phosphate ABC transporter permease PstA [Halopseudomonas litoralis]SDS98148.1 phosphate transport system permease protein [Halopseudomonas litoralis]
MKQNSFKTWFKSGSPWIWMNAGAVSIAVVMTVGLLALIAVRGLSHFWPSDVIEVDYRIPGQESLVILGEVNSDEEVPMTRLAGSGLPVDGEAPGTMNRQLLKVGNRDLYGADFRWVIGEWMENPRTPEDVIVVERREWGNFYGYLVDLRQNGEVIAEGASAWPALKQAVDRALTIHEDIQHLEKGEIGRINAGLEQVRLQKRGYELRDQLTPELQARLDAERAALDAEYAQLEQQLQALYTQFNRDSFTARVPDGREKEISLGKVVRAFQPNNMGVMDKTGHYFAKLWEFVSDEPREANTEGGVFPAIFGTVLMVLIMSVVVTPFGVLAAVYLREYAKQGVVTRIIRIAVNNLAGVPSIVYGVFGLGFFIYFLGGSIDSLFFPEALPTPTFGTGGMLWASLTLALLTVPVVIVSTEEGLTRIPRSLREGSLALGATKSETLWKIILPMSSPAMMTGLILAVARAAGEVAPLMLVGVVKLAPSLAVNANYPYLHLDQKFMHLGFHIYDVGFQSPNVEAARPLVYATALLLVGVIATLNFSAVAIRNHLREKYKALEN